MKTLETTIDIDAPADIVWDVLTDFERYPEWNDYTRIAGEAVEGAQLRVAPGPRAGRMPTFTPRVLRSRADYELRWLGHLYVRGLFDGEHRFTIEALGDGRSRLTQAEQFSGLLVGPIMHRYGEQTRANFESVNRALKRRAEGLVREEPTAGPDVAA
ncbi:SRPBCC domain-containing protein [Halorientalis salina]|uniref:SRPBCC domain-containing protein n=1 Tax=Halorientalis salina TaxID=2932266 RepID=UPI0010AD2783|nr:SRPBCC domain-containing protein [Halorientalis salina]